jgi:ABC-type polysaccharide/polyol phosphate transport system ATPase subunit
VSAQAAVLEIDNASVSFRKLTRRGWGRAGERRWALKDVSLRVTGGEIVGIIGGNGSGKTTLLHAAAGVYLPAEGSIRRRNVSSLVDLSLGTSRDLTAFEYLRLMTPVLGYPRRALDARMDGIIEFSGLAVDVLDQPMRTYSSGMVLRVAFALAISLPFDLFLMDEVLAVGDADFQHRCVERLKADVARGAGVVIATHDPDIVATSCDRVGLLDDGQLVRLGAPSDALSWFKSGVWGE